MRQCMTPPGSVAKHFLIYERLREKMDIAEVILKDHQEQRYLFSLIEQLDRSATDDLSQIWGRLSTFLEVHARAEELFFYPTVLRDGRGEGGMPDADSETKDAIEDHNEIRDAIAKVAAHKVGSSDWFKAINEVNKANSDHMGEEERQGLADFRRTVTLDDRHALAIQFIVFEAKNIHGIVAKDIDPDTYLKRSTAPATPAAASSNGA